MKSDESDGKAGKELDRECPTTRADLTTRSSTKSAEANWSAHPKPLLSPNITPTYLEARLCLQDAVDPQHHVEVRARRWGEKQRIL